MVPGMTVIRIEWMDVVLDLELCSIREAETGSRVMRLFQSPLWYIYTYTHAVTLVPMTR